MKFGIDRGRSLVVCIAGFAFIVLLPASASAQYGGGFGGFGGFGWGFGFRQAPSPTAFLNQAALARIGQVHFGPQQNSPYAGNPNAYFNQSMDNGFVDRYRADRREPAYYATQYTAAKPSPEAATAPTAARAQPSLPLASFYKADGRLEWPSEAPLTDELKPKRDEFDKASKVVLDEIKKSGSASIISVSDARQKLLDYGRPALHYARARDTARVADTFHLFLLSLYESLAQAANPSTVATPSSPPLPTP